MTDKPKHYPFEPEKASIHPYRDDIYNEAYFIAESFEQATNQLRDYVKKRLPRKFEVYYDSITQQLHVIDNLDKLKLFLDNLNSDVGRLNNAVDKLKLAKNSV